MPLRTTIVEFSAIITFGQVIILFSPRWQYLSQHLSPISPSRKSVGLCPGQSVMMSGYEPIVSPIAFLLWQQSQANRKQKLRQFSCCMTSYTAIFFKGQQNLPKETPWVSSSDWSTGRVSDGLASALQSILIQMGKQIIKGIELYTCKCDKVTHEQDQEIKAS